jgi:hypothetical protein
MLSNIRSLLVWTFLASLILQAADAQTSCPADFDLQPFNNPQPSQSATFLDIEFTCIYNDLSPNQTIYQFVPAPFIRVEPGDNITFYSTPPDIYDIVDRDDGATVSLAHNPAQSEPGQTLLVITWPAAQLQKLRVGSINGTLLLAEGFTALQEINVTGRLGGMEGFISTEGTARLRLTGENQVGKHIEASDNTKLDVYIETGVGNVEITAPANSITGEVHAVRMTQRTGSVSLKGVESLESTGLGPGLLYADNCESVNGNCNPLDHTNLTTPVPSCRLTKTCLVTAFTRSQPVRTCTGQVPEPGATCRGNNPGTSGGLRPTSLLFCMSVVLTLFQCSMR